MEENPNEKEIMTRQDAAILWPAVKLASEESFSVRGPHGVLGHWEEMRAYAEGAEIQCFNLGQWTNYPEPRFLANMAYRAKPAAPRKLFAVLKDGEVLKAFVDEGTARAQACYHRGEFVVFEEVQP